MVDFSLRKGFHLCRRGLSLWRREGLTGLGRKCLVKFRGPPETEADTFVWPAANGPDRIGPAPLPSARKFRVAFIGSGAACEAQSMRYRAHNIIEALALAGLEGVFVPLEEVPARLDDILAHDLLVLVRLMDNKITRPLTETAQQLGLPVVYDIDDYLFDPWVMPYIEALRVFPACDGQRILGGFADCLRRCEYFTGSTAYLAEKAAALGKKSFVLPNGLNAVQIDLSRQALAQHAMQPGDNLIRIGYFSGTRTHQADFRLVYPALMALLREQPQARLLVVGDLALDEFPGLACLREQIETLPLRPWTELPAVLARVAINLIPLERTPFNEGKSNLKYYEAGLLHVPSIASPTRIHRENIRHGENGFLARTPDDWYDCLNELVGNRQRREQIGRRAFEHVLQTYTPLATARQAVDVYRQILRQHRLRRGIAESALHMVIHLGDTPPDGAQLLRRANELIDRGHQVTLLVSPRAELPTALAWQQHFAAPSLQPRFAIQCGGELPCCDVLLTTDSASALAHQDRAFLVVPLASLPADVANLDRVLRQAA